MSRRKNRKVAKRMAKLAVMFQKSKDVKVVSDYYFEEIQNNGIETTVMAHLMTMTLFLPRVKKFSWFRKLVFKIRMFRYVLAIKSHPKIKPFIESLKKEM